MARYHQQCCRLVEEDQTTTSDCYHQNVQMELDNGEESKLQHIEESFTVESARITSFECQKGRPMPSPWTKWIKLESPAI